MYYVGFSKYYVGFRRCFVEFPGSPYGVFRKALGVSQKEESRTYVQLSENKDTTFFREIQIGINVR